MHVPYSRFNNRGEQKKRDINNIEHDENEILHIEAEVHCESEN